MASKRPPSRFDEDARSIVSDAMQVPEHIVLDRGAHRIPSTDHSNTLQRRASASGNNVPARGPSPTYGRRPSMSGGPQLARQPSGSRGASSVHLGANTSQIVAKLVEDVIALKSEVTELRQTVRRQGWVVFLAEVAIGAYACKRLYEAWQKGELESVAHRVSALAHRSSELVRQAR